MGMETHKVQKTKTGYMHSETSVYTAINNYLVNCDSFRAMTPKDKLSVLKQTMALPIIERETFLLNTLDKVISNKK